MSAAANEHPPFKSGEVLGKRFEIVRRLGAGGFGTTYEAKQLVSGRPMRRVALKVFHEKVNQGNLGEIFSDAIELAGLYEHEPSPEILKALIQVYDIGIIDTPQGERAFLCMKLVPGGKTLEQPIRRFRDGGMPLDLALRYLRELLVPLAWMHTKGECVHGDLKPDNVLLSERDEVILTDFGLAAHILFGAVGGAIQYQAPESLTTLPGEVLGRAGTAADVFCVGLIWYEMLTGRHPFDGAELEVTAAGSDQSRLIQAHREARKWPFRHARPGEDPWAPGRIVPPSEINEELRQHPQLEALLRQCLAYRARERPGHAGILLDRLDEYLRTGVDTGAPTEPPGADDGGDEYADPDRVLAAVLRDFAQGRLAEARAALDALLARTPVRESRIRARAFCVRARMLLATGRRQDAETAIQEARALNPNEPWVFATLAVFYEKENPGSAEQFRKRAFELGYRAELEPPAPGADKAPLPADTASPAAVGSKGNPAVQPSAVTPPKSPESMLADLDAQLATGRINEAVALADAILAQCPPTDRALRIRALCAKARTQAAAGQAQAAVQTCQQAQALDRDEPLVYDTFAALYDPINADTARQMRARAETLRRTRARR